MKYFLPSLLLLLGLAACAPADEANAAPTTDGTPSATERIISLSGFLTELVYDLGFSDQLVGIDVTSTYPPAANQLPKLGHVRKLNVEGVLELKPTLILADEGTKDQASLGTLEEAGINILYVPSQATLNNAAKAAELLAEHLPIEAEQVRAYAEKIAADSLKLVETLAGVTEPKPRVLFIYARGAKQVMVAGADTEAAAMISMAGGENAITSFTEFKPLTPEALVEAAPDVILMFESGLASLDGKDGLANIPGISQTPAFKNDRVIAMDGHYLLGFGPRAAQAANELAKNLYPSR